jgi:hypothetical protein
MIRFHLKCDQNHQFESWFQSNDAFDKLAQKGLVACAICGSVEVSKSVMAPAVATKGAPAEHPLAALRRKVEESADYVGASFATEARAIHDGDAPDRPIYGEARPEDARRLLQDGIPVLPLPFVPAKKSH